MAPGEEKTPWGVQELEKEYDRLYASEGVGERLRHAASSFAHTFAGSVPALVETAQQASDNAAKDRENGVLLAALRAREASYLQQAQALQDAGGLDSAQYEALLRSAREVRRLIEQTETHTPVNQYALGQHLLRKGAAYAEKATDSIDTGRKFLGSTAMSIANNAGDDKVNATRTPYGAR